jgi:hypothetical protein
MIMPKLSPEQEKAPKQINIVTPLVQKIFERSMVDADFRKLALTDPDKAVKALGEELPEQGYVHLKFIDNSGTSKTIPFVLPDPVPVTELSEKDLARVAGGTVVGGDGNKVNTACCVSL